eukprot:gene10279-biopygen9563
MCALGVGVFPIAVMIPSWRKEDRESRKLASVPEEGSYSTTRFCPLSSRTGFVPSSDSVLRPGGRNIFRPGSVIFGPGSLTFRPGSVIFGPGSVIFSPGSVTFHPGSTYSVLAPTYSVLEGGQTQSSVLED